MSTHQEPAPRPSEESTAPGRRAAFEDELDALLREPEPTAPDRTMSDSVPPDLETVITNAATVLDERTEVTPTADSNSARRSREAQEIADRLREWESYAPTRLAQTAAGYRALIQRLDAGAPVTPQMISDIQRRREEFAHAQEAGDTATMGRILQADRAFKVLAVDAVDVLRGQVERNPIPDATLNAWEKLGAEELESLRTMYEKGIEKHAKPEQRVQMRPEEISRAYHMREEFTRAHAKGNARLAAIVLEDDAWYKRAARDTIADILAKRHAGLDIAA
ncbi:MAG: hypothetical protein Q7T01_05070 [bacterium]|nr:hypothetical protein [bacterium]